MSAYFEPTDVGPASGGHLRVSDAQRSAVAAELAAARDDGRLTGAEYDDRATQALSARTRDDLVPLIRDLADPVALGIVDPAPTPAWPMPPASADVAPLANTGERDWALSLMSDTSRRGTWAARPQTVAAAVMGDVIIDLSTATWPGPTLEIVAASIMGDVKLIVPPDVEVHASGLGCNDRRKKTAPASGRRLIVKGFALMGDLKIVDPK